jgi:hypothetical protein
MGEQPTKREEEPEPDHREDGSQTPTVLHP